ncbi:FMN-linked oxidoreductase [Hanseniaspora valbyensis NRRL Y-1626]|uniref:tRNA-dihydrouridine(16/17) synthase [NAD(P)(+)] n=1 Tax=Hanseniaspora valbyensis NRRL Y-1626 TaxID=766949 RepID=A0A1B7TBZ1_9ASCO|nr:FMN-linked oxidoreductase [Hanseniaspora valbyensis NRRL Y-1626]
MIEKVTTKPVAEIATKATIAATASSTNPTGRTIFNKLNKPRKMLCPLVDHSELAFRILMKKYGCDLAYTPMLNAKMFAKDHKYRVRNFGPLDGKHEMDRPLVVQFCSNDIDELIKSCEYVKDSCDMIDLNLGCPQNIARSGHYGSFLMEDWPLIEKLIDGMHTAGLNNTCKIRIFSDIDKSLDYAQMCVNAGAKWIGVHGRMREQRGQATGLADLDYVKYIKEKIVSKVKDSEGIEEQVVISNGNMIYPEDINKVLEYTGCDAVMSGEGALYNPGIYNYTEDDDVTTAEGLDKIKNKVFPRVDFILKEYYEIVLSVKDQSPASMKSFKSHVFKLLRPFFEKELDLRNEFGPMNKIFDESEEFKQWIDKITKRIDQRIEEEPEMFKDEITLDDKNTTDEVKYYNIPFYRCQPYFRVIDGVKNNERFDIMKEEMDDKEAFLQKLKSKKQKIKDDY